MDNLTHSLVGAVLGQMGLKRKTGLAMPALIIAANIPDIDAVAVLLGGNTHLAIRRGITHGPIAMLLLPLLLWAILLWFDRWQMRRGTRPDARLPVDKAWLLVLCYIGCISHPALDWLNSYGIRLLEPFSSQWYYGDSIFIIDVWIWAALIAGVWVSLKREKQGRPWVRPAQAAFAAVFLYVFGNGLITAVAESDAASQLAARHDPTASFPAEMVVANPVPITFWKREILWRDEVNFGSGSYQLGSGVTLNNDEAPQDSAAHGKFSASIGSDERAFRFWSRMPVIQKEGGRPVIRDQRFLDPLVRSRFEAVIAR
jgi:inner membrane protein